MGDTWGHIGVNTGLALEGGVRAGSASTRKASTHLTTTRSFKAPAPVHAEEKGVKCNFGVRRGKEIRVRKCQGKATWEA